MKYRPEIDGLRALAVIPVILFHAGFRLFSGGFVGVDVFFVISGYLITSVILAEKRAGTFTLASFYERRARRILPALFVVMFACLPFAWLWLLPSDMKVFSQSLVAVSGFSSNVFFFLKSGYFDASTELVPLLHTWSLAVEEQYYMLFPIVLLLTWKVGRRWIVTIFAVVAVISLGIAQWGSLAHPTFTFFLLPTRVWELLIGVFAAFYLSGNDSARDEVNCSQQFASFAGLSLIAYAVCAFDKGTPFPSVYALIPTIGTALIIVAATPQTLVGRLLGSKHLVGVGLISYSAYLWHQPLFAFARHRSLNEPSFLLLATLVLATAILAYLTWKYVETPFRDRRRFSRAQIFRYGAVCTVFFLATGFAGHAKNGFTARTAPSTLPRDYFESAALIPVSPEGVDGNLCISEGASIGRVNIEPDAKKILLVGDSHSADYSAEFRRYVTIEKLDAWQFSVGGCGFLPSQAGVNGGQCGKAMRLLEEVIEKNRFDDIVVIGAYYSHTGHSDKELLRKDMDYLSALIHHMLQLNAHVIFFTPRYSLSVEPMRAAMLNKVDQVKTVKEAAADYVDSRIEMLTQAPKFTLFNERDRLIGLGCGDAQCFNGHTSGLNPLYRDTNHLTNYGAKLVFQQLTSAVKL
ncbi:acyltransferase [Geomonas sp. RF6]|uniref:acyltransferase family protein n=1 Tax=Geomonas sp. RF6 TaxID=2897342 RepID=UPI001E33FAA0|nr:acyltransferase family protein [Geomonas sp. RF6]UFS70252.1 acyltransferase [Geomonas sp. RF6]